MRLLLLLGIVVTTLAIVLLLYIIFASRQHKLKDDNSPLIGAIAKAETDLDPLGIILISGEAWKAVATVKIPKDTLVKVVDTEGVLLKVEPILS